MTVQGRYYVGDPEKPELIVTFGYREAAFRRAQREARERGYDIEVFDSMARFGAEQWWQVAASGEITIKARRRLRGAA